MKKIKIRKRKRFGKLIFLKEGNKLRLPSGQTNRTAICLCDCGNKKQIRLVHLLNGRTLSCGCKKREKYKYSGTQLYNSWRAMKQRCKSNYFEKKSYYDKGIKVCEEWKSSFSEFVKWALKNKYKKGLVIDRINNSKGYYPENCRFVTPKINCNNKDTTMYIQYNGKRKAIQLVLESLSLSHHYHTIYGRIKRGYSPQRAIDTPIRKGNYQNRWYKKTM